MSLFFDASWLSSNATITSAHCTLSSSTALLLELEAFPSSLRKPQKRKVGKPKNCETTRLCTAEQYRVRFPGATQSHLPAGCQKRHWDDGVSTGLNYTGKIELLPNEDHKMFVMDFCFDLAFSLAGLLAWCTWLFWSRWI